MMKEGGRNVNEIWYKVEQRRGVGAGSPMAYAQTLSRASG